MPLSMKSWPRSAPRPCSARCLSWACPRSASPWRSLSLTQAAATTPKPAASRYGSPPERRNFNLHPTQTPRNACCAAFFLVTHNHHTKLTAPICQKRTFQNPSGAKMTGIQRPLLHLQPIAFFCNSRRSSMASRHIGALGMLAIGAALLPITGAQGQQSPSPLPPHIYEQGDFRVVYQAPWQDLLEKFKLFDHVTSGFAGGEIQWYYNDANRPAAYASANEAIAALQNGMQQWQTVCNVRFVYKGTTTNLPGLALDGKFDGQSTIGWHDPGNNSVAGTGGVGTSNGQAKEGDVWLSSRYRASNKTIIHELGHMMGIAHSDVDGVVMSGPPLTSYSPNPSQTLQPDDIAACRSLYGTPSTGTVLASVAPTVLNFGNVVQGQTSAAQTVTLTNQGTADLTLTQAPSVAAPFAIAATGTTCAANTTLAASQSCTVAVTYTPTALGGSSGSLTFKHNASPATTTVPLNGTGVAAPTPVVQLTPDPVNFGAVTVGSNAQQDVTVRNSGNAPLNLTQITAPAPFSVIGGSCAVGTPVAAGSTCTVRLRFTPTNAGNAQELLRITHNGTPNVSELSLRGQGANAAAPNAQLSTNALNFSGIALNSTSPAQTVTLTNNGTAPLRLGTAPAVAAPFQITGGTCTANMNIAPGDRCTISVVFKPTTAGPANGSLTIAHNAAGSPATVALRGVGQAAPAPNVQLSPTTLDLGNATVGESSAVRTVTLTNNGTGPLTLGATPTVSGPFEIAAGSTCTAGANIAAGGSCSIDVLFKPTAAGPANGALSIAHNAAGSPSIVTLRGVGQAAPAPNVQLSPAALDLGSATVGASSAAQTVTLTNNGTGQLTLSAAPAVTGPFEIAAASTCTAGANIAAGDSCTISVVFKPTAAGPANGTLSIAHNAAGSPATVALRGAGQAAPAPTAQVSVGHWEFGVLAVGNESAPASITFTNSGTAPLTLTSPPSLTGPNATAFVLDVGSCNVATLAPGASCTVQVRFKPTATGLQEAELRFNHNAAGSPTIVRLRGGVPLGATPVPALAPLLLLLLSLGLGATGLLQRGLRRKA
ncbi:choice-of-anchor D domain-containing protein [Comamonadaceae bacterium OH2310_COT-174]|nr:choice-of-anchor D domain-containing protein [Comamonadaceae bacterium OH2310_COT-174]